MILSLSSFLQAMTLLYCKNMYLKQHYVSSVYPSQGNKIRIGQTLTMFTSKAPFLIERRSNKFRSSDKFSFQERRCWKIQFALNTGGIPGNDNPDNNINEDSPDLGQTRLSRILIASGKQFLEKLNSARKNFPMKVFVLLLGFYTANALSTILGQTGDWDVLVAAIVVAAIEGVGMLMYKRNTKFSGRMQSLIVLINYWKAGVCLGFFVDAFKVGS